MEYITLGNSDLKVSRICMGGCPMGGYGWGNVKEQDFIDTIQTALENGINFFDTADTYGLGQSESTLSKGLDKNINNVIIESKFGVKITPSGTVYDNTPEYIEDALNGTLKRLGREYIDIYTIHYRDYNTPMSVVFDKLIELRQKGKIRYFGLSNIFLDKIDELLPFKGEFVCCQDEYSLACRKNESMLINIENLLGTTPLTWGSLGQGVLTGKYSLESKFDSNDRRSRDIYVNFHGEKMKSNLRIVNAMRLMAEKRNISISSIAIRFILDKLTNSVVLVGAKKPSQIIDNIKSIGWILSDEEISILERISE